jgi:hypothetical protein
LRNKILGELDLEIRGKMRRLSIGPVISNEI